MACNGQEGFPSPPSVYSLCNHFPPGLLIASRRPGEPRVLLVKHLLLFKHKCILLALAPSQILLGFLLSKASFWPANCKTKSHLCICCMCFPSLCTVGFLDENSLLTSMPTKSEIGCIANMQDKLQGTRTNLVLAQVKSCIRGEETNSTNSKWELTQRPLVLY